MLFLILNILIGVTSNSIQNYYCKNLIKNSSDSYLFILIVDMIAVIGMFFIFRPGLPSQGCLKFAVVQGILVALETASLMEAMRVGSFSLTFLFSLSALLVPVCASPFLFGEQLTLLQGVGTVLMLISMAMTLNVGSADRSQISKRWLFFAVAAFFLGGSAGIVEKTLQYALDASEYNDYAFYTYITLILTIAVMLIARLIRTKEKITLRLEKKHILPVCFIGGGNPAIFLLTLAALRVLPTATCYGISNGSKLMLTTVVDVVLFKQKLKLVQYAGLGLGLVAIIFLSL